ncbi:MAG: hypothetical protein ACYCOU_02705 [Sulfobacillus sp.]
MWTDVKGRFDKYTGQIRERYGLHPAYLLAPAVPGYVAYKVAVTYRNLQKARTPVLYATGAGIVGALGIGTYGYFKSKKYDEKLKHGVRSLEEKLGNTREFLSTEADKIRDTGNDLRESVAEKFSEASGRAMSKATELKIGGKQFAEKLREKKEQLYDAMTKP